MLFQTNQGLLVNLRSNAIWNDYSLLVFDVSHMGDAYVSLGWIVDV